MTDDEKLKELGDLIHKRGNDIAFLKNQNKKLREVLEALLDPESGEVDRRLSLKDARAAIAQEKET